MPWFHHDSDEKKNYEAVQNAGEGHKASLTHEVLAGAAAYEAAQAWEKHQEKTSGQKPSHAQAKAVAAAAITAFLDREIESKGLDWLDQHKLKKDAQEHAEAQLKEEYN